MNLQEKIAKLSQFPRKERSQPYQSYWHKDVGYIKGSRDTLYRYNLMGVPENLGGMSVLDLGSQLGAMSIEACRRGASRVAGLEYEPEFVECAKELAAYNGMKITFKQADLKDVKASISTINTLFNKPVDIVLALSLTKHIGVNTLTELLRGFKWKQCFVEGHNCNGDLASPHCQDIINNLIRHFPSKFVGYSEDRSIRPVWILTQLHKTS